MINVRRYREGDAYHINTRIENAWDAHNEAERADTLGRRGTAFTFYEGSARADTYRPVMLMGCNKLWQGCFSVWALPSHEARGYGLQLVRAARLLLDLVAKDKGIHRYHTLVHPKVWENIKWIKLLGFEAESVLRKAGPDHENIIMYAKHQGVNNEQAKNPRTRLERNVAKLFNVVLRPCHTTKRRSVLRRSQHGSKRIEERDEGLERQFG